jgi:hypothetical protein
MSYNKPLTFEDWYSRTIKKMAHLDVPSLMAWAWSAALEQGAIAIEEKFTVPGFDLSDPNKLRNLKCFFCENGRYKWGGFHSDRPRRFFAIRGGGTLAELKNLARVMVPGGEIWPKDEMPTPPMARIESYDIGFPKDNAPIVFVEVPQDWPPFKGPNMETEEGIPLQPSEPGADDEGRCSACGADDPYYEGHMPGCELDERYQRDRILHPDQPPTIRMETLGRILCENSIPAFNEKMMPGQAPYTPEERAKRDELVQAAARAEELIPIDELEGYAQVKRERVSFFLPAIDHNQHGRGSEERGPDDSDCPCRKTPYESQCAQAGCGFCRSSRTSSEALEGAQELASALDTEEGRAKVGEALGEGLRETALRRRLLAEALETDEGRKQVGQDLMVKIGAEYLKAKMEEAPRRREQILTWLDQVTNLLAPRTGLREEHTPPEVRSWILRHHEKDLVRVSGEVECIECKKLYRDHPEIYPTLVLLCDGRLGKT